MAAGHTDLQWVAVTSAGRVADVSLDNEVDLDTGGYDLLARCAGAMPLMGNVDIGAAAPTFQASDGTAVV